MPGGRAWLLLDAAGALHRLPIAPAPAAATHGLREAGRSVHVETGSGPDPAAMAAGGAATRAADAVFQVLNAACQGQLSVASMAQQLARSAWQYTYFCAACCLPFFSWRVLPAQFANVPLD